jgi:hypothetical protein
MAGLVETSLDRPPGIVDATVAAIAGRHRADRDRHAWPPALHAHQARQVRAFTLLSGARACPERTAAPFCLAVGRKPARSGTACRSVIAARKEDRGQRAQGLAVLRGSLASVPPLQAARDLVFAAPPFNLAASPDAWSCCSGTSMVKLDSKKIRTDLEM